MNRLAQSEVRLRQLLNEGRLAKSNCSAALLVLARPLLETGVVAWQRSGAGQCLELKDESVLRRFLAERFPQTADTPAPEDSRVAGVGRFRNSKAVPSNVPEIVHVRLFRHGALRWGEDGKGAGVGAVEATRMHGVFALVMEQPCSYRLSGRWALVENPVLFHRFERLHSGIKAVFFGRGRLSMRLLRWIRESAEVDFELIHFPDYDPVGMSEFARVREVLGSRAGLYLPSNLEGLFARYGTPELLKRAHSQRLMRALRLRKQAEIQRVLTLIDRHNAGLEQESLLLQ